MMKLLLKKFKKFKCKSKNIFIKINFFSSIKDSLRKKTSDAYEKGIFGAPTFVV